MLKNRDLREKEQEFRSERKIQKERELEGDQFQDKESFVTPAYTQKLKELKEIGEELEKQDQIENFLDVKKQGNTDSFRRYLYRNLDNGGKLK